jgi:hypothetical protein
MAWSGSDILYIINDEMLCPKGGKRASNPYSRYTSELSDFSDQEQTELTLLEYARGIHRSSTKKTC